MLLAAAAMAVAAAAAATGKLVAALVLGTTVARFATTGVYELTADGGVLDVPRRSPSPVARAAASSPSSLRAGRLSACG
jgi:hypothetical protein